jgi:hypothetical protein
VDRSFANSARLLMSSGAAVLLVSAAAEATDWPASSVRSQPPAGLQLAGFDRRNAASRAMQLRVSPRRPQPEEPRDRFEGGDAKGQVVSGGLDAKTTGYVEWFFTNEHAFPQDVIVRCNFYDDADVIVADSAAAARAIPPGAKRRGETRVSIRGDSWKRYTCDYHAYRSD